jgi:hypothetical protein
LLQSFFGILLEDFAGAGNGDFSSAAVEQPGSNFFFQRANLRRNRRLRTETALRRSREAPEPRDFSN